MKNINSKTGVFFFVLFSFLLEFKVEARTYFWIKDPITNSHKKAACGNPFLNPGCNLTLYNVTGGGNYCSGSGVGGVSVGLNGSDTGVNYQLYLGANPVPGASLSGTGSSLNFGAQTAGTYTVIATEINTGCTAVMNLSALVVASSPPNSTYTLSGASSGCRSSGVSLTLSGSQLGVKYQIRQGFTSVGSPIAGTGNALTLSPITKVGTFTYHVDAVDTTTGCTATLAGSATLTIYNIPALYTVSGINLCAGNNANDINLSNSELGVSYKLILVGTGQVDSVMGTGNPIDFIGQTVPGTYQVIANNAGGCTALMKNTAIIPPILSRFVLGSGSSTHYCNTSIGASLQLNGSTSGVNYQMYNTSGSPILSPIIGNGSNLIFSPLPSGSYYVIASSGSCSALPTDTVQVISDPNPNNYQLFSNTGTGNAHYCAGSNGVSLLLSNSDINTNYQLMNSSGAVGSAILGIGDTLHFPGLNPSSTYPSGQYYVMQTLKAGGACPTIYSDTVNIIQDPLPISYNFINDSVHFCIGGTGGVLALINSEVGNNYNLLNSSNNIVSQIISSPGGTISFSPQPAGNYTISATNPATNCSITFSNQGTIIQDALPIADSITPFHASYCSGQVGIDLQLSGSQLNTSYQLYNSSSPIGSPIIGTGKKLDLGIQPSGSYYVIATQGKASCTISTLDTAQITAIPSPVVQTLIPAQGHYCIGDSGIHIKSSSSEIGVQYQLLSSGIPLGPVFSGTGNPIDFGLYTSGSYSVLESNAALCSDTSLKSTLIADNNPNKYVLSTPNTHFCHAYSGVILTLSNSDTTVQYQLMNNGVAISTPQIGTGNPLNFGPDTAGTYYVVASNLYSTCNSVYSDTIQVIADQSPNNYFLFVEGGAIYCKNSPGVPLSISPTDTNTNYQLFQIGVGPITGIRQGTGDSILFPGLDTTGQYYVSQSLRFVANGPCTTLNSDTLNLVPGALPIQYPFVKDTVYACVGGSGGVFTLSNSEPDVEYQVYGFNNGVFSTSIENGTGGTVSFTELPPGQYSLNATNRFTGCGILFSFTGTILLDSLPKSYSLTPLKSSYCISSAGNTLNLSGSDLNVHYQLFNNGNPVGNSLAGTGGALALGTYPAGNYYMVATKDLSGCISFSTDTAMIIPISPQNFNLTGNNVYCPGSMGTMLTLANSQDSVLYQLQDSGKNIGMPKLGSNGTTITFDSILTGSYLVLATLPSGCSALMNNGNPYVVKSPLSGSLLIKNTNCNHPGSASLQVLPIGGRLPYQYLWSNGGTNSIISNLNGGTYQVTVSDSLGCTISLQGSIANLSPPMATNILTTTPLNTPISVPIQTYITFKDTLLNFKTIDLDTLKAGIQDSMNLANIGEFISDSTGTIRFTPANNFNGNAIAFYNISDVNGCTSNNASIKITVLPGQDNTMIFPNVFTPNGDGVNDDFQIGGLVDYPNNTLEIFNRWGSQVYYANGYMSSNTPHWNGSGLGEGTYYYILNVVENGSPKVYSGYIFILRSIK